MDALDQNVRSGLAGMMEKQKFSFKCAIHIRKHHNLSYFSFVSAVHRLIERKQRWENTGNLRR